MSTTLPISTVVSVSIAAPQPGFVSPNVNNIAICTTETPVTPGNLTTNFGIYSTAAQVATDWGTTSEAYLQAVALFNQKPNLLAGGGQLVVYHMTGTVTTISQAVADIEKLVYVGSYLVAGYSPLAAEYAAAAVVVTALGKMLGVASYLTTDVQAGGMAVTVNPSIQSGAICLLYTQGGSMAAARTALAAGFGSQIATNFSGQNTTINQNLKTLQGITGDAGITPAVLGYCQTYGWSCYGLIQGVPAWIENGGVNNVFWDNIYNQLWFTNALATAYANVLKTTSTKIPQTERGMTMLKNAIIAVCQQAVLNGYVAPGQWNANDTFGDQVSFLRNIAQNGFYVWSSPVSAQSQSVRVTRAAPLIQLAVKLAGAVNSGSIIGFINP